MPIATNLLDSSDTMDVLHCPTTPRVLGVGSDDSSAKVIVVADEDEREDLVWTWLSNTMSVELCPICEAMVIAVVVAVVVVVVVVDVVVTIPLALLPELVYRDR